MSNIIHYSEARKHAENKIATRFQKIDKRLAKQKTKRKSNKHFSLERQRWRDRTDIPSQ
jgi:hypothetical protein